MKINEIFYSLQGEGIYTGTPAVFVRFSGCNRSCPFCDTDFGDFIEMSDDEIIEEISRYPSNHIVLTGGEPSLQLNEAFIHKLKEAKKYIQIETNGTLPLPKGIDWITCSPKTGPWNIEHVDELKIVFEGQDVENILEQFKPLGVRIAELQPCSGKNTKETISYILEHPHWRLSLQTHKLLNIR